METKHKTWEECCDEVAKKFHKENWELDLTCHRALMREAAELYNQETASECDRLKLELEKEITTGRQEWERLQLDKIDSLKEENERLKKELTYFKEGAEYQLGVEHGCDSLKQINSELVECLFEIFNILRSPDTCLHQSLPTKDSYYSPENWIKKTESVLSKTNQQKEP